MICLFRELPDCVTEWTHDHVKLFMLREELDTTIFPLCKRLDGTRLVHLYEMCLMNRESMYQSLKLELNSRCQLLLPVGEYITFLHALKPYIPVTSSNGSTTQSSLFSFEFCNIL
jgi:hypothetical protein